MAVSNSRAHGSTARLTSPSMVGSIRRTTVSSSVCLYLDLRFAALHPFVSLNSRKSDIALQLLAGTELRIRTPVGLQVLWSVGGRE